MQRKPLVALTMLLLAAAPAAASDGSLRGSPSSMERQHQVAVAEDYTFLRTPGQVQEYVREGRLVEIVANENFELARVSFPYGRPELGVFIERIAMQYRRACGERLVVTSLTRPLALQPRNAHALSVHPAGMAVDFRISQNADCRSWMEETLLSLERGGVLDITRERNPPHYHVALFPEPYMARVASILSDSAVAAEAVTAATASQEGESAAGEALRERHDRSLRAGPILMTVLVTAALFYLLSTAPRRRDDRADA